MTLRLIFGLGWSLVTGLAGLWLAVAPWALGEQGSGDWTTVTRAELVAGAGLVVLGVVGVVVVVLQVVRSLREAGVISPARAAARAGDGGAASSPEMEKALIALAQALAEDLDAQRTPAADGRAGSEAPGVPSWREPK
jgi:hypothetical protein